MLAQDLITDNIPPLKVTDSGLRVIDWMYEFKTTHLPVVDKGKFLGLISEDDIIDFNDSEAPLSSYDRQLYRPSVLVTDHIYEVVRMASQMKSPLIPVVDAEENYCGLITMERLLSEFARLSGMQEPGAVLVLRLPSIKDYVLSDIARLVESNDTHILGTHLESEDDGQLRLTLKVNTQEVSTLLATLERFDYEVESYHQEKDVTDVYRDRYDSLMNYLNI